MCSPGQEPWARALGKSPGQEPWARALGRCGERVRAWARGAAVPGHRECAERGRAIPAIALARQGLRLARRSSSVSFWSREKSAGNHRIPGGAVINKRIIAFEAPPKKLFGIFEIQFLIHK